jgi:hypothetical protein
MLPVRSGGGRALGEGSVFDPSSPRRGIMEGTQECWWKRWFFWILAAIFLILLAAGVPLYFVWRVSRGHF